MAATDHSIIELMDRMRPIIQEHLPETHDVYLYALHVARPGLGFSPEYTTDAMEDALERVQCEVASLCQGGHHGIAVDVAIATKYAVKAAIAHRKGDRRAAEVYLLTATEMRP